MIPSLTAEQTSGANFRRNTLDERPYESLNRDSAHVDDGRAECRTFNTGTMIDMPAPAPFVNESEIERDDERAPLIGRGVYCTPWYYHGRRWLFVVDHTHSVLHLEPVLDNGDRDAQIRSLRVMLSALDPIRLELVE